MGLIAAQELLGTRVLDDLLQGPGMIVATTCEQVFQVIGTPLVVGRRAFCAWGPLYCLDLDQDLATLWTAEEPAVSTYASLLGGPNRVLVVGAAGELILVNASSDQYQVVSRLKVFSQGAELYAHPALVGDRLYIRGETELTCLNLSAN